MCRWLAFFALRLLPINYAGFLLIGLGLLLLVLEIKITSYGALTIGGLITVSPVEVAADGSWLIFAAPPGPAGTCQFVNTDPPLPFPLPAFCYANDA